MLLTLLIGLLFLAGNGNCQEFVSARFLKNDNVIMCDVPERVDRGCSYTPAGSTQSHIACLGICARDTSCIGASVGGKDICFLHRECPVVSGCTVEHGDHRYMAKYCKHGVWNEEGKSCSCVDGFFGKRCDKCHKTCLDLNQAGYPKGQHRVYLDPDHGGETPILANCQLNPSSNFAAMNIFKTTGTTSFNRTWNEYVNGFYFDHTNFWTGLYSWHKFSNAGYKEMIFVLSFLSRGGNPNVYRVFNGFVVGDENSKYSFSYRNSAALRSTTAPQGASFGNCLNSLQNVPFSTWDADHDTQTGENCASRAGSGWWYSDCNNPCNALGFGLQYLGSKPEYQLFSLLGIDNIADFQSETLRFHIYIKR